MDKFKQPQKALHLAYLAHKGQKDRGGEDYIKHVVEVANNVSGLQATTVAYLHDILEDTDITEQDLRYMGFEEDIIEAVVCITKTEGEDYESYIKRVKSNKFARIVKIQDLLHNMRLDRLNIILKKDIERNRKYLRALEILIDESTWNHDL